MSDEKKSYGSALDWSEIIKGGSKGAGEGMKSASEFANTKVGAKEAKRRTLGNLASKTQKRNRNRFKNGQDYQNEINDYQTQALQNMAKGFVDSLKGSNQKG